MNCESGQTRGKKTKLQRGNKGKRLQEWSTHVLSSGEEKKCAVKNKSKFFPPPIKMFAVCLFWSFVVENNYISRYNRFAFPCPDNFYVEIAPFHLLTSDIHFAFFCLVYPTCISLCRCCGCCYCCWCLVILCAVSSAIFTIRLLCVHNT